MMSPLSTMFRAACAVALLIGGTTCAKRGPAPKLYDPNFQPKAEQYGDILESWSASDKIYKGLENKLFVTATYHSSDFRRAFAVAFPEIFGHGGEITRRELVDLSGDVEQYHSFFVAAYTPDIDWNDLDQPDSIWRLSLTGDGHEPVAPAKIIEVKADENLKTVYPYIMRFHKTYLVRFPVSDPLGNVVIGPSTKDFHMRIVSALGSATLDWRLTPMR